jgi:hypothetical protein
MVAQLLRAGALKVLLFWYYGTILGNDDIANVGFRGRVFYIQYYYFWEHYFSDLSSSEGGDYLDTGRSISISIIIIIIIISSSSSSSSSSSWRLIPWP